MHKEREIFPKKGPLLAVASSLLEKMDTGFLLSSDDLMKVMAGRYGDSEVIMSKNNVANAISRLRPIFRDYELEIFCEPKAGYELVRSCDMKEKRKKIDQNFGPHHSALVALLLAKNIGLTAPRDYLKDAMIEGYNERNNCNIDFFTDAQFSMILLDLRKDLQGIGYKIIYRNEKGYEILSPEELGNIQ